MTVHDDLATLRSHAAETSRAVVRERIAALDRVEAEIARLEGERDEAYDRGYDRAAEDVTNKIEGRAEAAEAEIARLRDGLRRMLDMYERHAAWCYNKDAPGDHIHRTATENARALLADQDGAATCEKCRHHAHEPGACEVNVGTGYHGPVLCRCGVQDGAAHPSFDNSPDEDWGAA